MPRDYQVLKSYKANSKADSVFKSTSDITFVKIGFLSQEA